MRNGVCLLLCIFVAACAGRPPLVQRPDHLFHDHLFAAPAERVDAADVFALNEPMKQFLQTEIRAQVRAKGARQALIDALYKKGQLKLDYDASITRNAAQAFAARAGNCLSLVLMTAAFAKELGLQVGYQSAYQEEAFNRSSNLLLRSGHVNVTLGRGITDLKTFPPSTALTIDFLPPEELRGLRTREISEDTVVAMYLNNRAVEALVAGRIDAAYAWARAAIGRGPGFVAAQNTLGVVYLRHGDLTQAETVFKHVLAQDRLNKPALSNLAASFARQGRIEESMALQRRLAQIEPEPPFHHFNLGLAAMEQSDFRTARDLFAKEVARADYNPEFHFWLGLAHFRLGEMAQARKHLALALQNSTTRSDRDLYAAKLAQLRESSR